MNQVKWKKERKSGVKMSLGETENVNKNKILFSTFIEVVGVSYIIAIFAT